MAVVQEAGQLLAQALVALALVPDHDGVLEQFFLDLGWKLAPQMHGGRADQRCETAVGLLVHGGSLRHRVMRRQRAKVPGCSTEPGRPRGVGADTRWRTPMTLHDDKPRDVEPAAPPARADRRAGWALPALIAAILLIGGILLFGQNRDDRLASDTSNKAPITGNVPAQTPAPPK
jgi:hypothetical protein